MATTGGVARLVCGRWSKWIVLGLWIVVLAVAGPLAGKLSGVEKNDNSAWLPGSAEATQVSDLGKQFETDDIVPAGIVYERSSGITPADQTKVAQDVKTFGGITGVTGQVIGPLPAKDGKAVQVVVPIKGDRGGGNKFVDVVDSVKKTATADTGGLAVYLAGPAA